MNYALFYSVMQHMWVWGYKLNADPSLVLEYVENMKDAHNNETVGIFVNQDMDRFMGTPGCKNVGPELIVHPTLEDLFVKE